MRSRSPSRARRSGPRFTRSSPRRSPLRRGCGRKRRSRGMRCPSRSPRSSWRRRSSRGSTARPSSSWARAQELARALAGTAVPFDELATALATVDIVITSTGAPEPVIRREFVQPLVHSRRGRPLFFIDIAVPRDVEDSVDTLDGVYCYDIDDLKQVVDANIRERLREAHRAEALVEREVAKFLARLGDVEVIPTIVSLRERLEIIRSGEVKRTLARLPAVTPETREAIEALST